MKYKIKYPPTKNKRQAFLVVSAIFLIFFAGYLESILRDKSDLENLKVYCGKVDKYYFDKRKIRGFATWRVVIKEKMESLKSKTFLVGEPYILKNDALSVNDIGKGICINYLTNIIPIKESFIVQIYINGNSRLDHNDVQIAYLSPPSILDKSMAVIFFILGLLLLIQFRKD
tara:strand:- start:962 stop:1477 length:516 start_codon:yes stop_codon:yes gene_type:complete